MGRLLDGLVLPIGVGPVRLQVVEHALALTFLDVQTRQAHDLAVVVPRIDDLGLDDHARDRAVGVGLHHELANVEAQLVEALDALPHAPPLAHVEGLRPREHLPQVGVAGHDAIADLNRVDAGLQERSGLEVHEFADDVRPGDVDVVQPLALRQSLRVELTGLGVDQISGEGARVAPEERVGQRDIPPVEAEQVQAHEQDRQSVDQACGGLRAHVLAEQGAIGEGVGQVLGDEHGVQGGAGQVRAARDDSGRRHARRAQAHEAAEQLVLAIGDGLADLLDGDHALGEVDEPHDVSGQAAWKCREDFGRPRLQWALPRQVEQRGVDRRRGNLHGLRHENILSGNGVDGALSGGRGAGPHTETPEVPEAH